MKIGDLVRCPTASDALGIIKEFFDEHEEDDDNIRFVRIGEDLDDKEVMGYYQEDTIYIPSPGIHF